MKINITNYEMEKIKSIFKEYPYIASAYLFGSHATGKTTGLSDIDIGILLKEPHPEGKELIHEEDYMAYRISALLDRAEVDLIHLNGLGLIFLHNILKSGKLIYDADPNFRIKFVSRVISFYCDFEPTLRFMNKYYPVGYKRRIERL